MTERHALTLNLTEPEIKALDSLAEEKGITKTAVLRQALRLYQSVHYRLAKGEKIFFEDKLNKEKAELMVL